tara:strand:+ start:992 stop:2890 length:1899 start_codon:yes stop_codon:yes gene_type:complete
MTVIQPNSVAGINSITVQNGNSLAIHKADGSLLRTITGATGVTTFATASVGAAWTDFSQGGGLNIGLGASISNGSGNELTLGTNGDDRFRITGIGSVGIGTLAPHEVLHVYHPTANGVSLFESGDATTWIGFRDSTSTYPNLPNIGCVGDDFRYKSGGTERLRITSGGSVGINTDSIGTNHNLEIFGNASAYAVLNVKSQSLSHGATLELGAQDDDDYGSITQFASGAGEGARMAFVAGTTQTMNLRDGRLLVGHTASEAMFYTGRIQVQGTSSSTSAITVKTNQNDSGGPAVVLGKSRGAIGSATIVQSGDELGSIHFTGADGTDTNSYAASISCNVDATPGSNDMPGRILFKTTADGAASPTERMRINREGVASMPLNGVLSIGNQDGRNIDWIHPLQVEGTSAATSSISITRNSNDINPPYLTFLKTRGGAVGGETACAENDLIGNIQFKAADGDSGESTAAQITCEIDAAVGNSDTAGRLFFKTSADGSGSPASRMEINKDGYVYIKTGDLDVEAGSISDSKGNVRRVIENEPGGAAYQMVAADAGKFIHHNNTIKMPNAGQLSIGDMVTIYAYGALTLDCTKPDGAEALIYNAADATTGDRTFAARALGTLLCVASNTYVLSGAGIS